MRYKSVEVQAPAKVNLQLSVGPKEADGYHQVVTVFQAVSLMDVVKISESDQFAISIKRRLHDRCPARSKQFGIQGGSVNV